MDCEVFNFTSFYVLYYLYSSFLLYLISELKMQRPTVVLCLLALAAVAYAATVEMVRLL